MPACFQLVRVPGEFVATLNNIDTELCQNLGFEWDEKHWTYDWYNVIGLRLALGQSWEKITEDIQEHWEVGVWREALLRIVAYLQEYYRVEAWYQRHK